MSMELIEVSDDYIDFMKRFFYSTMMDNKPSKRTHGRKYLGIMIDVHGFHYFAPLSSPKPSDFDSDGSVRKSSSIILRMVAFSSATSQARLLGTIKLNNMIPVPDDEIIKYDASAEPDIKYQAIVMDELLWIQKNTEAIQKAAKRIYNIKQFESININASNAKFYQSIVPFADAEKKCQEYIDKKI